MKIKIKYIIGISIAVLLFAALAISVRTCTKRNQEIKRYEAISDTLKTYKNKYNQEVAKISVIEAERNKDFLKIKSQDKEILELQTLVKEYKRKIKDGGSATIIYVVTEIHDTIPVYYKGDTMFFEDQNEWIDLIGQVINNELSYNLLVRNKFKMILGEEKGKKYVEFISENPYTRTETLRVYQNTGIKKHFGFGLNFGMGVGYDIIHNKIYIGPGVNFGINYNF